MIYKDEEFKTIDPVNMEFNFEWNEHECYEARTGICSLQKADNSQNSGERGDSDFCPKILKWMQGDTGGGTHHPFERYSRIWPVTLAEHDCPHYSFSDGRHRTCIAQRTGQTLIAIIERGDTKCSACKEPREDEPVQLITPDRESGFREKF